MQTINPLILRAKAPTDNRSQLPLQPQNYLTNQVRDLSINSFYEEGYKVSSLVRSLVDMRANALSRAPICLYDVKDPKTPISYEESINIPLYRLLNDPVPDFSFDNIIHMLEEFRILGGCSYLYISRGNRNMIEQLAPYTAAHITPINGDDQWLDHYKFDNGQGFIKEIPKSEIIRFPWHSYDPKNYMRNPGPLASVAREIDCDNQRVEMQLAISQQGIAPSYIVTTGPDQHLDANNANLLAEMIQLRFGSKNRSRAALLNYGSTVQQLTNNLGDYNSNELSKLPETRVAQELEIPLQILSWLASADMKTYTNFEQAIKQFYKTLERTWGFYAKTLTKFFQRPENQLETSRQYIIGFDLSNIDELHDGVDLQQDRWLDKYNKGGCTLNECREGLGLSLDDTDKGGKYFSENAKPATSTPE